MPLKTGNTSHGQMTQAELILWNYRAASLAKAVALNAPAVIVAGAAVHLADVYYGSRARTILALIRSLIREQVETSWLQVALWWHVTVRGRAEADFWDSFLRAEQVREFLKD